MRSCVAKVSCLPICLSLASPPLSWHRAALCSDLWRCDRSVFLRAASPLQTLQQMTRCMQGGYTHTRLYACKHTHAHTHTYMYTYTPAYTQIYMGAWDVLTCPLGLPGMPSSLAAANSPFQPLTLPEAGLLQWRANDLPVSVRPSSPIRPSHTFLTFTVTIFPSLTTLPLLLIASLFKLPLPTSVCYSCL